MSGTLRPCSDKLPVTDRLSLGDAENELKVVSDLFMDLPRQLNHISTSVSTSVSTSINPQYRDQVEKTTVKLNSEFQLRESYETAVKLMDEGLNNRQVTNTLCNRYFQPSGY